MLRTKTDTGTAHTPGPWEFGKDRRWLFRDNLKHDGNFSSSTVLKIDDDAFRPSEADARLIAAAPDMLAALKAFIDAESATGDANLSIAAYDRAMEKAAQMAKAAIKRAEGRS